jgi:peptidoglycan/LPS O-acetylase OafA/YrhL
MTRIRELDGLRFFAIISVLLVHYRPPYMPGFDIFSFGWVGVDLFFVISGFLITTILVSLRGSQHPYRVFYWRRVLRIFPPYYLVLLPLSLLIFLSHAQVALHLVVEAWVFLLSLMGLSHQIVGAFQVLFHGAPLSTARVAMEKHLFSNYGNGIFVFWSLSVEELFYLIWAPIILKCSRRRIMTVGLLAILVCPLLRVMFHTPLYPECFSFFCRFDTLMMGSLLSLLFIAFRRGEILKSTMSLGLNAAAVGSVFCLASLCIYSGLLNELEMRSSLTFSAFGYTLLGIFFAAVVGICVMHAESRLWWAAMLRARPLVYIGTISYMMYLIHIPVWVTLYKLLSLLEGKEVKPGLLLVLLSVAVTVAVASLSWKFLEKPILQFKDAGFAVRR